MDEVALWEQGAVPPRHHAQALSDMFGLSLDYLLDCRGTEDVVCARCGVEGPGNPDRYEQGWDVAGGTELCCPDCLQRGDLDW